MIRIQQIKLPIDHNEVDMREAITKKMRIKDKQLISYKIHKRSLDARRKPELFFVYVLDVKAVLNKKEMKRFELVIDKPYQYPKGHTDSRPVIVGFGPAGMFAAYLLAKAGCCPIVVERGEAVDERTTSVSSFWQGGALDPESNVQFGEGGAGTFSDGKLTTRSKDHRARLVMDILVEHGAPEEIRYVNKPHVGTDVLKDVVKSMRETIINMGGKIHFSTRMDKLLIEDGRVVGIQTNQGLFHSKTVILAIGHSARDTYQVLYDQGLSIAQKPFAMGVRIEHHQSTIDQNQYGSKTARNILGASDYKLTHKSSNGRSVYSFCVCPGGMVVASASEIGGIVVNGMSEHARDQENINGALLVQINTEDFESEHPLAGVAFQRKYERLAFELTEGYTAPMQTVGSFMRGEIDQINTILPSYRPQTAFRKLSDCLPSFVITSLQEGIEAFGKKINGFDASDAILTGVETRSSAPIRMARDFTTMESNITGLYPIGEGAGYAGGIVSSAIDGIKIGEIVANA